LLTKSFQTIHSLDPNWVSEKTRVARSISRYFENGSHVLSFGCGLGLIEVELARIRPDLKIDAYDQAKVPVWFRGEHPLSLKFMDWFPSDKKYQHIYLGQDLYGMSSIDAVRLLRDLRKNLKPGGIVLTIHSSVRRSENGFSALVTEVLRLVKLRTRGVSDLRVEKCVQFWGWQRDNQKIFEILLDSGLRPLSASRCAGQSFIQANVMS
jgi:Methyltransferase domain